MYCVVDGGIDWSLGIKSENVQHSMEEDHEKRWLRKLWVVCGT